MSGACVYLVDDQPAVLKALGRVLASAGHTVRSYASAREFLAAGHGGGPGCLVLDLSMPEMNGIEVQRELARRASRLPVIFLTGHGDIDTSVQAMKLGAADFLTKPVDDARLLAAVAEALARSSEAQAADADSQEVAARLASLTAREREVMELVVEGLLNKQIADRLGSAEKTVKVHRGRVMAKMQVRSVSALVRLVDRARGRT